MLTDDGGVCSAIPGGYALADPQETVSQQTVKQETGNSKFSKNLPIVDKSSTDPGTDTPMKTESLHSTLIAQVIAGYSILFHDRKHERSNGTRAMRLWHESGVDEQIFVALLHEARRVTQQRGNIEREATDGSPEGTKNRMPYYFRVVEDLAAMARSDGAHTAA
jgi:hypothetical protein